MISVSSGEFEVLHKNIGSLMTLNDNGHDEEARLLCVVYIDRLANWLQYPEKGSAQRFSRALMKYGGNERLFSLILPKWLMKVLPWSSAPGGLKRAKVALAAAIASLSPDEMFPLDEFLNYVRPQLPAAQVTWLERDVWRGSIAYLVYRRVRVPGVHERGLNYDLSFVTTFRGDPIPPADFHNLHAALVSLAAHAKQVAETTGRVFRW